MSWNNKGEIIANNSWLHKTRNIKLIYNDILHQL